MATRFFRLQFKLGSTNELTKLIRNYNEIYNGITEALKKVNNKDLLTVYKDAITDTMSNNKVRFGKRMDKIIRKFRVIKTKKTSDNITYNFTNDVLENGDFDFKYETENRTHKVAASTILKSLQYGRRWYVIPSTNNTNAECPLVWWYGSAKRIRFNWKSLRRRVHVLSSKSKIYHKGIRMGDAAAEAVANYIDGVREEIRRLMKGK